jgi:enamine deaminase RidA (YjgF/YER057c/UK114 family)
VIAPSERLAELGLTLPAVAAPLAAYVPAVRTGNLVYSSGQLPTVDGQLVAVGRVGAEVTAELGADCARVAVLNGLAAVAAEAGGLDAVIRVVKVVVFVASTPDFTSHPQVGNGASQLLAEIFGTAGEHARSAVGVASLPLDAPVEVELIVEVTSTPSVQPVQSEGSGPVAV